jgi:outer membrane receptor protein involved in Fe transport
MWSTLYPATSSNSSQASHLKNRFFLLTHLRFLRQMLLPNRRPVRNTNRCAKPSTRTQQWKQAIATTVLILVCGSYGQVHGAGVKATDSTRYTFDIPALKVEQALSQLAKQTGHQLLFSYAVVGSHKSTAVSGDHSLTSALQQLLQTTPLTGHLTERGVIVVTDTSARNHIDKGRGNMNITTKKGLLAGLVGVFAAGGMTQATAQGGEAATGQSRIEEIIVTATKRAQSLQDTALSISALGSEEISKKSLVGMNDYLRTLPGVNIIDRGPGRNAVIVRGVAADPEAEGFQNGPTVGIYLGETPISTIGVLGASDIKLVDMERVEVLRGPQGTLYGSSSLSGTVRNIPNSPNLTDVEGRISATYSNTAEEGSDNSDIQGTINIPIIKDQLAIRATAYTFDSSGYIKNNAGSDPVSAANAAAFSAESLAVDQSDVGSHEYEGGRITVLWQPTDNFSASLLYLSQDLEQHGFAEVDLDKGTYEQARFQLGDPFGGEKTSDSVEITSLTLSYEFEWINVFSNSSWANYDSVRNQNIGIFFGGAPIPQISKFGSDSFIQEIRFSSEFDGPLQFIVGYYYENVELYVDDLALWSGDDLSENFFLPGERQLFTLVRDNEITQNAFFGEVSYDFSDQLQLTLGSRRFDYDKRDRDTLDGFFAGGFSQTDQKSGEKDALYKANFSYTPNEDSLIYLQWGEGFRLGTPIVPAPASLCDVNPADGLFDGTNVPIDTGSVDADNIESVELGGKFTFIDNRLTLNASVFKNKWTGIPVSVSGQGDCAISLLVNAGEAKTQGIELESTFYVTENFKIDIGFSLVDAELTKDAPGIGGFDGDRLPGSPEKSYSIGFQYDTKLSGYPAFIRSDYAYVGDFYRNFQESGQKAGDYHQINLRSGIVMEQFEVDVFVNNLTNSDELTWLGGLPRVAYRLRPRTFGLSVAYTF